MGKNIVNNDGLAKLRGARPDDRDFCWTLYAEAVKPFLAPYIATRFNREWNDDVEKISGFLQWWTPQDTCIVMLGDTEVGWLHFEETPSEVTLVNFSIASKYRGRGIASDVIQGLLENWKPKRKPIVHTVLKDRKFHSPFQQFFERFGFSAIGEDELTIILRRPA